MENEYKICPICNLNYISNNEESCKLCADKKGVHKTWTRSATSNTNKCQGKFTIKNERMRYRGKLGFQAFNDKEENVGIVYMCDDKRLRAYGKCELCFYSNYQKTYGQWHIVKLHGEYYDWLELCKYLTKQKSITLYLD